MNYLDFIIIAFILLGFVLGFKDGLIRKLIGLSGVFLGIFLAVKLSDKFARFITPVFNDEVYLAGIAAPVVIFLLTILAASIIKRLVHPHDKVNRSLNQILGGVTGIIQIVFFLSAVLLLLALFKYPANEVKNKSMFYGSVYSVVPTTVDFLIGGKDFVKEYIEGREKASSDSILNKKNSADKNDLITKTKEIQKESQQKKPERKRK